MPDGGLQVVMAVFIDMDSASIVLAEIKQAKRKVLIDIEDAAVIIKDADGRARIRETNDMGIGKGATISRTIGAVLSLITTPLGWMVLEGGTLNEVAGKMVDDGFPQNQLVKKADALSPGSSALVVLLDQKWLDKLECELVKHDAVWATWDVAASDEDSLPSTHRISGAELKVGDTNEVVYVVATTGDAIFSGNAPSKHSSDKGDLVMHDSSYAQHSLNLHSRGSI